MTDKQTVTFGDICREVKLTTKDPIADGYERYIGLEHLDSGSLKIKRWGLIAEDNPSFNRVFKKGHILFGKRRPYLKKAAIAEFDGICSGDIIVMEASELIGVPEILPYLIHTNAFWSWAVKSSSGSLSPRTKFKSLSEFDLTLPSKEKLESIHRVLISIWELIEKYNDCLVSLSSLTKSIELSHLAACSEFVELGTLCEKVTVGIASAATHAYCSKGTLMLRNLNIKEGYIDGSDKIFVTKEFDEQYKNKRLRLGDVVTVRTGYPGASAVINETYEGAQIFTSLISRPKKDLLDSDFLAFYINSVIGKQFISKSESGGAQKNVNAGLLKKMPIPNISVEEQVYLRRVLSELYYIQSSLTTNLEKSKSISDSILESSLG